MNYFDLKKIIAFIIILYLLEVALVTSSKPIGEGYLSPVLKYEKLDYIKAYPLYQDDANLFTAIRVNSWIMGAMNNLAKLFWSGLFTPQNNSIESGELRTPEGNVTYYPKAFMVNSQMPSGWNRCHDAGLNPRTGADFIGAWGSMGIYYPFVHKEYYAQKWAKNYSTTPEKAWENYTNIIESQTVWDIYASNVLMGYTPTKDIRAVYYYGSDGKLIVQTQMLSEDDVKDMNLFVDGEKRNFESNGSVLIADVGKLESGRHSAEIRLGSLSKKLDFNIEWVAMSSYKLSTNDTLDMKFINLRNESITIKKFTVNDTSITADQQLPAFGEGLIYDNEYRRFVLPTYNVSLQLPLGKNDMGDCRSFNIVIEYSLPDGRIVSDEWENFGMIFEI